MQGEKNVIEFEKEVPDNGQNTIEERKELIEDLYDKVEEYVKTNIQLAKFKAVDKLAEVVGSIVVQVTLIIFAFFFLMMLNMGIAFWLGDVLGATYYGFLIVAGFYAFLLIVFYVFRNSILKTPISNSIISQILK